MHQIVIASWERGDNLFGGELVQIFDYKLADTLIQDAPAVIQHHVICVSMVLLEGEIGDVVFVDLADIVGEPGPCFLNRYLWTVLEPEDTYKNGI